MPVDVYQHQTYYICWLLLESGVTLPRWHASSGPPESWGCKSTLSFLKNCFQCKLQGKFSGCSGVVSVCWIPHVHRALFLCYQCLFFTLLAFHLILPLKRWPEWMNNHLVPIIFTHWQLIITPLSALLHVAYDKRHVCLASLYIHTSSTLLLLHTAAQESARRPEMSFFLPERLL